MKCTLGGQNVAIQLDREVGSNGG